MFSFFKKIQNDNTTNTDDRNQSITKMSLEERKDWRLNMLCKSIHDVLLSIGIPDNMYKFRVMPVDDRGHHYAVMIETLRSFSLTEYTTTKKLLDIEIILKARTFDSYGIVIDGVFWKTTNTVDLFDATNLNRAKVSKNKKTIHELREMVLSNDSGKGHVKRSFVTDGKVYDTNFSPLSPD